MARHRRSDTRWIRAASLTGVYLVAVATLFSLQVGEGIDDRYALCGQLGGQSRQQFLEDSLSPGQQRMDLLALGNASPVAGLSRQAISLDDDDVGEQVGENPSCEQPGNAATEHHSSLFALGHVTSARPAGTWCAR